MINDSIEIDQTLALAGIIQVTALLQQLAYSGNINEPPAFNTSIESIFVTNAANVPEIYNGILGLALGLRLIGHHLGIGNSISFSKMDSERLTYFFAILRVTRQLRKRPAMLSRISAGIELAHNQARHIPHTHQDIIASLANLYMETFSKLNFRIMVNGEQQYLTQPENMNMVRALLLAGVRSAILFYQRGGRWWLLLTKRHRFINTATDLLKAI